MNKTCLLFKISVALLACILMLGVMGCDRDPANTDTDSDSDTADTEQQTLDYSNITPSDYVKEVTYKGLEIVLETEDSDRENALWEEILVSSCITDYPEDQVEYYFDQTKEYYMHTVNYNEEDYQLLLRNRGTNEEEMREEAKTLVAKDLLYHYIVDVENIAITEDEKEQLFNKYVDKYVTDYGYSEEYVLANMTDFIHESMLYDKTMEFLLSSNTFKTAQATEG